MALYTITVLGAPWPSGAVVGDVIELSAVPAWAAGKCELAGDGAAATVGIEQPAPAVRDAAVAEVAEQIEGHQGEVYEALRPARRSRKG